MSLLAIYVYSSYIYSRVPLAKAVRLAKAETCVVFLGT